MILKFRYRPERAEQLQSIANADYEGNLSGLLRDLADGALEARPPTADSSAS